MLSLENKMFVENMKYETDKERYIVAMLIHTLYSNDVNDSECYRIVNMFKEKVLGDTDI